MNYRKATVEDILQLVKMRLAYLLDDYGSLSEEETEKLQESLPVYYKKHLGKDIII